MGAKSGDMLDENKEQMAVTSIEKRDVSEYMTGCLDLALKKGVEIIGKQGGFIYQDQYSGLIDFDVNNIDYFIGEESVKLPVMISNFEGFPIADVPIYPCYSDEYNISGASFLRYKGDNCYKNFYDHSMVGFKYGKFLTVDGIRLVKPGLCNNDIVAGNNDYKCSCRSFVDCKYSIQNQLENYVKGYMLSCVDFESFKERLGYDIVVGDIIANVSFGDKDTSVKIYFPVMRDDGEGKVEFKDFDFISSVPVRLKTIYGIVHGTDYTNMRSDIKLGNVNFPGILEKERSDILYDVVEDTEKLLSDLGISGIKIEKISTTGGSVIKIIDEQSVIDGEEYELMFFVENRRPALDRLRVRQTNDGKYDLYLYEGEELFIRPIAYDPDDDNLIFKYSGWKADYDEIWDDDTKSVTRVDITDGSNAWYDSIEYREGLRCQSHLLSDGSLVKERCAAIPLTHDDIGEHDIRISVEDNNGLVDYEDLKVFVDNKPLIGFEIKHPYTEEFLDKARQKPISGDDYMMGSILPSYIDGLGFVVSIEDPMWFDSSMSLDPIQKAPGETSYRWNDSLVNETTLEEYNYDADFDSFPLFTFDEKVLFPFFEYENEYDTFEEFLTQAAFTTAMYEVNTFGNISIDKILQNEEDFFPTPEERAQENLSKYLDIFDIKKRNGYFLPLSNSSSKHLIELKVYDPSGNVQGSVKEDLYVAACLPYRSDIPPYPFNTYPKRGYIGPSKSQANNIELHMNPYYGNHTCCLAEPGLENNPEEWEIADEGFPCFGPIIFGLMVDDVIANESMYRNMHNPFFDMVGVIPIIKGSKGLADFFQLVNFNIAGECDGKRGNICKPVLDLGWSYAKCLVTDLWIDPDLPLPVGPPIPVKTPQKILILDGCVENGEYFSKSNDDAECCDDLNKIDFGDDFFLCTDASCGDGVCEYPEYEGNCLQDCCIQEGATYCSPHNYCCPGLTPLDYTVMKYCSNCGDGTCATLENKTNCAADCCYSEGEILPGIPGSHCCSPLNPLRLDSGDTVCTTTVCGDGGCQYPETETNCATDCYVPPPNPCGDGDCDAAINENCNSCRTDCGTCPIPTPDPNIQSLCGGSSPIPVPTYDCGPDKCCQYAKGDIGWGDLIGGTMYPPQPGKSCNQVCQSVSKSCIGVGKGNSITCTKIVDHRNSGLCSGYSDNNLKCNWNGNCAYADCNSIAKNEPSLCRAEVDCDILLYRQSSICFCDVISP